MKNLILIVGADAQPNRVEIQQLCDKYAEATGRTVSVADLIEMPLFIDETGTEIRSVANGGDIIRVRGNYYLKPANKRQQYGRMSKGEKARRRKERWS